MREKDKRTRNRKIWIQAIEQNIIILSLSVFYIYEKWSSSTRRYWSINFSFIEFMIFLRNSSSPGSFVVIPQTRNEFLIILGWLFK